MKRLPFTAFLIFLFVQPLFGLQSEPAKTAFSQLEVGNQRFAAEKARHPNQDAKTRASLVAGQAPSAIVLSCSDSRVPPEIIFDQGLGDVFTVRTAGEVPDDIAIASIEYALEHLGTNLLVVLGHESCGAVKAALETPLGSSAGSPALTKLVDSIRPHFEPSLKIVAGDKKLVTPVKENVVGVAKDLLKKSSIIRESVEKKGLIIKRGIYSLETGKVEFF